MADENGAGAAVGVQQPVAADDPLYCALPGVGLGEMQRLRHEWRGFPLVVPGAVVTPMVFLVTYCIHCRLTMTGPLAVGRSPLVR